MESHFSRNFSTFQDKSGHSEELGGRQSPRSVERVPQLRFILAFLLRDGPGHVHVLGLLEHNLLDMGAAVRLHLQHHRTLHNVSGGLGRPGISLLGIPKLKQRAMRSDNIREKLLTDLETSS